MRKPAADHVVSGLAEQNPTRRQANQLGDPGDNRNTVGLDSLAPVDQQ